ncbi:hypothetical protein M3223_16635 [Paenibacillus pasadenensis]|uniref:hypothetical protein n=1 Tax=Paenibacillus pasadenensis TaxID=217090 RepID=UPI00203B14EC|nr:hypothetical protein [Paenibacillus pasadenensis]MCM3748984.1 hypothetical protein [Paenibacillus pasadenensis]
MTYLSAQTSNLRGPAFGTILTLFILLIIATSFVCSSTEGNRLRDSNSITTQQSKQFTINNQTANFSLASISLEGEFEDPFPAAHIILPYRSYNFEVLRKAFATYRAYVTYEVLSGTEVVGDIRIFMKSASSGTLPDPSTEVLYINGPISFENGKTHVTVRDA